MADFELAQLNIASLLAPMDSPQLAGFNANLDRINALADAAPGFVWRLANEEGDARPFGPEFLVNVSVWRDIESLKNFVYNTAHTEVMRRRKEWFGKMQEAYVVLWWVPAGHQPSEAEAKEKLELLWRNGPSPDAFTFKEQMEPPR